MPRKTVAWGECASSWSQRRVSDPSCHFLLSLKEGLSLNLGLGCWPVTPAILLSLPTKDNTCWGYRLVPVATSPFSCGCQHLNSGPCTRTARALDHWTIPPAPRKTFGEKKRRRAKTPLILQMLSSSSHFKATCWVNDI